jgi:hypothetical protein
MRLMTDAEMAFFIDLREIKGDKAAAKYVASLGLFDDEKEVENKKVKKTKKHESNK